MNTPVPLNASRSFKRDRRAWLILLIAIGAGLYMLYASRYPDRLVVAHPAKELSDDPLLLVLSYGQVSDHPDAHAIGVSSFNSHLRALREEGFRAVGLDAVDAFYRDKKPLPSKSVLLMFEGGYLSTYEAVSPVLKAFGWKAVMVADTGKISEKDTHILYWDRLDRMVASGHWDLATSGHAGRRHITVSDKNEPGPFQARRLWLPQENRAEDDNAFYQRIANDQSAAKALFSEKLNDYNVIAYVPAWGNFQSLVKEKAIESLVFKATQKNFRLAFDDDVFGLNNRYTSPLHLKRMRVDRQWPDRTLASYLGQLKIYGGTMSAAHHKMTWPWRGAVGDFEQGGDHWTLKGRPRADIWLPGLLVSNNWVMEADIQRQMGQIWLVQRDANDPKRYWRVGGDERGVFIQSRDWRALHNLATFAAPIEKAGRHKLRITKRGHAVWVELDGRLLSGAPIRLEEDLAGDIGWVAWQADGRADIRLARVQFSPLATEMMAMTGNPSRQAVQQVVRKAKAIEALTVPMWKMRSRRFESCAVDTDLLNLLSHRYCLEVIPVLTVESGASTVFEGDNYSQWLNQLDRSPWRTILVDLSKLDEAQKRSFEFSLKKLEADIGVMDKRLLKANLLGERITAAHSDLG